MKIFTTGVLEIGFAELRCALQQSSSASCGSTHPRILGSKLIASGQKSIRQGGLMIASALRRLSRAMSVAILALTCVFAIDAAFAADSAGAKGGTLTQITVHGDS